VGDIVEVRTHDLTGGSVIPQVVERLHEILRIAAQRDSSVDKDGVDLAGDGTDIDSTPKSFRVVPAADLLNPNSSGYELPRSNTNTVTCSVAPLCMLSGQYLV